jgi:MoaA/NifB/PqqE/SkfB family radical SAM enzyme
MLRVLWKVPLFVAMRRWGRPRLLPVSVTVTPSPRCNSRCLTCNIWKKREDELSLEEWDRIFRSLGTAPYWFTVSGGEPFLNDILPLARSLYRHCRPGIVNFPTNGLLDDAIPGQVEAVCAECPDSRIIVNISLDGIGEKHDRIRGVPGNFDRLLSTYRRLRALRRPNLTVGLHSVISKHNVEDLGELVAFALSLEPDSYITEIAEERVELDTIGLDITPSGESYARAIDSVLERTRDRDLRGISKVTEAFRKSYYELVKRTLAERTQVIPCYAGWASAHIYADGRLWPCCVRADSMANLRDVEYDFRRAWLSPEALRIRRSIFRKECHCPLANAAYTNMLMNAATLARVAARVVRP